MQKLLINIITFYQNYLSFDKGLLAFLAPMVGSSPNEGTCKYEISCSEYTKQKIRESGVFKGSILGLKRIGSCR